jgi:hypothetical protein
MEHHKLMKIYPNLRIACAFCQPGDGIGEAISSELELLVCKVTRFFQDDPIPMNQDILLAYGPFRSLVPIVENFRQIPKISRPKFVFWQTESLPNPKMPIWMIRNIARLRSGLDRLLIYKTPNEKWQVRLNMRWLLSFGFRFRYYGDMLWLQNEGIVNTIAIFSHYSAELLRKHGINVITAYWGSYPEFGEDLGLVRDIPVIWLGQFRNKRRKNNLARIRRELSLHGIEMKMIDGVEHPFVFGMERTKLVNRSKIVLNLLSHPWDENAMRFILAACNKALAITEPTLPHTPFQPGIHVIEAEINEMTSTILHYLTEERERELVVKNAYELVTQKLTLRNSLQVIIDHTLS